MHEDTVNILYKLLEKIQKEGELVKIKEKGDESANEEIKTRMEEVERKEKEVARQGDEIQRVRKEDKEVKTREEVEMKEKEVARQRCGGGGDPEGEEGRQISEEEGGGRGETRGSG